jgi:hypothetical protein
MFADMQNVLRSAKKTSCWGMKMKRAYLNLYVCRLYVCMKTKRSVWGKQDMEADRLSLVVLFIVSTFFVSEGVKELGESAQDERFRLVRRDYEGQYASIYYCRLIKMTGRFHSHMKRRWPGVTSMLSQPSAPSLPLYVHRPLLCCFS